MTIKSDYAVVTTNTKDFVVPAGLDWEMRWAHIRYTSDATVGNRQIRMVILDDNGTPRTRFDVHAGAVQAASLERHYEFMQGIFRETSFVDGAIQVPLPKDLVLHSGWTLRFHDNGPSGTPISASDSMICSIQYDEIVHRVDI